MRDALKDEALSREMQFLDLSADTERDVKIVGYSNEERADGSPLVHLVVVRDDGMSVGATNIGLPGYQIALGFTEGSDPLETQHFTDDVIERLEKHWLVDRLPAGSAVLPQAGCQ